MKRAIQFERKCGTERGFTLVEMLIATVIVIVGLVAVAQLVPTSVMLDSNNRNDGTALVFAQRVMEAMREQPLTSTTFSDPQGVVCPLTQTCLLGNPATPNVAVGSPVIIFQNYPMIDYTAAQVPFYSFTYSDPNDPSGTTTDVRWAVVTNVNEAGAITSRRIILGVFRHGMRSPSYPIALDVMVEK